MEVEDNTTILEKFQNNFITPGHVPILIASKGLLNERRGIQKCLFFLQELQILQMYLLYVKC